jgi:molybdopterin adenylyltransferase
MRPAPIIAAVLTASDTRTKQDDLSGAALVGLLLADGASVVAREIVSDDRDTIAAKLIELSDRSGVDLILTTGGTGFAPRDNTPEATESVIERRAPGIAEAIRNGSHGAGPFAMLSRGVAGIRGNTLIINMPGSPKAVNECFAVIRPVLRHAIELLRGDQGKHGS